MMRNNFHYLLCFPWVVPFSTPVINTIGNIPKLYAELRVLTIRSGESNKIIPIELVIRKSDQRFVLASIMPSKRPLWHSYGKALIKDRRKDVKSLLNFLIVFL